MDHLLEGIGHRLLWDKDEAGGGGDGEQPDPADDQSDEVAPKDSGADDEPMIPKSRFDEVLERAKTAEQTLTEREEEELKEQEKWKDLYEKAKQGQETERMRRLRIEVASEKGLPASIASRLTGEDREEIEADADALVELLEEAGSGGKGIPRANSDKSEETPLDVENMTPAEIRKHKAELLEQS